MYVELNLKVCWRERCPLQHCDLVSLATHSPPSICSCVHCFAFFFIQDQVEGLMHEAADEAG